MILFNKIRRVILRLRLQPIRVYCLHHVCERFNAEWMHEGDWMPIDEFQRKILALKGDKAIRPPLWRLLGDKERKNIEFISLTTAYEHISRDWIRRKKYVVLTFDDGYVSLKEILPWLMEQNIPVTLFVNGKYLDGQSFRECLAEQYLTKADLENLTSPLIEIGSHGWEHTSATEMSIDDFESSLGKNVTLLSQHPNWIPFHAYTWGKHNGDTDTILKQQNIIPILIDGMKNYDDPTCIHRELLK